MRSRLAPLLLLCAITGLAGCGEDTDRAVFFPIEIHATAGTRPVEGVEITVAGRRLGVTDPQGALATVLEGREGTRMAVSARCPEGYGQPPGAIPMVLRRIARPGHADELRSVSVSVECPVMRRDVVVVVSTHGVPAIPVKVDGRTIATTDTLGFAHVALRAAPGASMRVQLDTSAAPDLLPRSPAITFHVPDRDEVVAFDRPLERAAPPPASRQRVRTRPRTRPSAPPPMPVPLRSARHAT